MPLHTRIEVTPNTHLYVWKITETLEFLRDIKLSKNSLNRLKAIKSISHQKGFLSIRHLLKIINVSDDDLYYNNYGKPLLKNNTNISISHSFEFAALVVSEQEIGIDIEKNRSKIKLIKDKFCNEEPEELDDQSFIEKLTFIWAAKESMFKMHPTGGMSFKNNLELKNFNHLGCMGYINTPELKQHCNITFYQIENYGLAVSVCHQ